MFHKTEERFRIPHPPSGVPAAWPPPVVTALPGPPKRVVGAATTRTSLKQGHHVMDAWGRVGRACADREHVRTQAAPHPPSPDRTAVTLFGERGFDGTPLDALLEQVEASRRTFMDKQTIRACPYASYSSGTPAVRVPVQRRPRVPLAHQTLSRQEVKVAELMPRGRSGQSRTTWRRSSSSSTPAAAPRRPPCSWAPASSFRGGRTTEESTARALRRPVVRWWRVPLPGVVSGGLVPPRQGRPGAVRRPA